MEPPATRYWTLAKRRTDPLLGRFDDGSPTSMRDTLPARSHTSSGSAEASRSLQKARDTSLLTEFIESKNHQILHLDKTIGDICWTPFRASRIDKRDPRNFTPYLALDPRSHRTAGPLWAASVRGADRKLGYFWSALAVDDVFLLSSSLACEGLVGLVYLWRWVKRMIVDPNWQKEVAVVTPPERHFDEFIWYSLGISVNEEIAILTTKDRSWTVSTATLLASDLEPTSRLEADIAQCCKRSIPLGVTKTPHAVGQSSVVTTISQFPTTTMKGTSHATKAPTTARPVQISEMAPYTIPRTLQRAHRQISAASAPLLLSSPLIVPSIRQATPGFGKQDKAIPDITAPRTVVMRPVTMSGARYIDFQRSPARSFSGKADISKSTEQTAPTDSSHRKGHKRKATEMLEGRVLPLRVRALRTDSIPVKATTWPEYRLLANFTSALSSRRGIYLGLLDLPKRKRFPVRDPRQEREVDQDRQRTKQPSDESTTRPLLSPPTVPPTSQLAGRPVDPIPEPRVPANPSEHCGPSSSVRDPHEPRRTSGALQAGTVKTHEPISRQACNRCHARRIKCTRTALNLMCDTYTNLQLVCEFDPICKKCRARRIKCTRTIPNLMCAPCGHRGFECDFGPTVLEKRRAKKPLLPSLAETLARIPSIFIPAGSLGVIRAETQPIAAPSSDGLFSYEGLVRDRLLIRTLQARDDPRWTRNSVRQTR